jgi:thiol-disulfide isomerase/thioredoxin
MILHPAYPTLSRYAADELDPAKRARVAAHLAGCARCRAALTGRRAVADALHELPEPELPADLFDRITARRAAGERVILPADAGAHPADPDIGAIHAARPRRRFRAVMALAAAAVAAAIVIAVRAPEAGADASELRLLTAAPRVGQAVEVEYRATPRLAGEERLVVRARLFTGVQTPWTRHAVLGELRRTGPRTFRGSVVLPDSVVYAVLAVEDAAGSRVDLDRAAWAVRLHGADGRPLLAALQGEADFRAEWDQALAVETAREMTRLYPDSVHAWLRRHSRESALIGAAGADSLRAFHRERMRVLDRRVSAQAAPAPEEMTLLAYYAASVDDTATERRWVERLLREHPREPAAVQRRVFAAVEAHRGDRPAILAALEGLWSEVGEGSPQLSFTGFMVAQQAGDPDALLRWGERFTARHPGMRAMLVRSVSQVPALRDTALSLLRVQLREMDRRGDADRTLGYTADEMRRELRRARGYFLGQHGKALLAAGRTGAALDTLTRAVESAWNVDLLRTVADTRLAAGDTAGALAPLARAAVDPTAGAAFGDSVRARLGRRFDAVAWAREAGAGRRELRAYLAEQEVGRPLRGEVRLRRPDGAEEVFRPASGGPTVVAFWSRYCPPSVMQMGDLGKAARELAARGTRVVTVTAEEPSAELSAYLREKGYGFPVLLDADGDAGRAFDNRSTPRYVVLDAAGRIRFESNGLGDLVRQVAYLREEDRAAR